jgi:hypothetical protein
MIIERNKRFLTKTMGYLERMNGMTILALEEGRRVIRFSGVGVEGEDLNEI